MNPRRQGWAWRQMRRLARARRLTLVDLALDVREGRLPVASMRWEVVPKPQCRRRRFNGPTRRVLIDRICAWAGDGAKSTGTEGR